MARKSATSSRSAGATTPEPIVNYDPIGHQAQRTRLVQAVERQVVANTLLFSGPSGIGKRRIAELFAQTLLCDLTSASDLASAGEHSNTPTITFGGCGHCPRCHEVSQRIAPDLLLADLARREEWNVDAIRDLLSQLQLSPFSAKARVVIFNDADLLSEIMSNVLLKTLEEPRPNSYLILVCANPSKLPQTVLSRCQRWHFEALTESEVIEVLRSKSEIESGQLQTLASLSEGSPGQALELYRSIDHFQALNDELARIGQGDRAGAITFAQALGKNKEELASSLRLLRVGARSKMRGTADLQLANRYALLITNLLEAERLILERHLNPVAILSECFTTFTDPSPISEIPVGRGLLSNVAA